MYNTMQTAGLFNQMSVSNSAARTRRVSYSDQDTGAFGQTLRQNRINQVKQEIYDKFQISVGSGSTSFSCYIPSNVLYQMSGNSELKEKVYEQLESYSPENYQSLVAGLNPPIKNCTLIFDEEGNATATLEAAKEDSLTNSSQANKLYQSYLLRQAAMLPYSSGLYSGYGSTGYGLNAMYGGLGYGLGSVYGLNSYAAPSLYNTGSLYQNRSLFTNVLSNLSRYV